MEGCFAGLGGAADEPLASPADVDVDVVSNVQQRTEKCCVKPMEMGGGDRWEKTVKKDLWQGKKNTKKNKEEKSVQKMCGVPSA